jgi:uncharacterized protein (TIGR00299 family) protein
MSKVVYLDVTFGAGGDMILASFIDLGQPVEHLLMTLKKLPLPEFTIEASRVLKNGFSAIKLDIACPKEHTHRTFKEIRGMIEGSALEPGVKERSIKMFRLLADAEAKAHGRAPEDVTFHEVGALDSIIDIVGIAAALDYFDVTSGFHSPIPLTGGVTKCMHGDIPALSPAAGILLEGSGFYKSDVQGELITPTAAAVIKLLCDADGSAGKNFVYEKIGSGAGTKEFDTHPNIMRTFLGESAAGMEDAVSVIETNIDDMDPRLFEPLMEALIANDGVLDAFIVPVSMKKGRPGIMLKVVFKRSYLDQVSEIIFSNSTTIGIRYYDVDRITLKREFKKVSTKYGEFSVKLAMSGGKITNASSEYDEVKAAAKKLGMSVKDLISHVNACIEKEFLGG